MKKYILLLPGALFPYTVLFALYCMFTGFLIETVFNDNGLLLLPSLLICFVVSLVCNIVFLALSMRKKWDAHQVARANMIIKLVQIPAYILIFILGLMFLLTVFTFAISILLVLLDCLAILLTGLTGASAAVRCYREERLSHAQAILLGWGGFIFCVDVVCAVILFLRSRPHRIEQA